MAAVKSKPVAKIIEAFNIRFPNRDKGADGWIGDDAHKQRKSSHNPDDTHGVVAEYSDSDTKQEVRAADIDKDLHDPHVTMAEVAEALRKDAYFRSVAMYMIFNHRIASRNTNWEWEAFDGDPHTDHLHMSYSPTADEKAQAFNVVLNIGVETTMAWTTEERDIIETIKTNTANTNWNDGRGTPKWATPTENQAWTFTAGEWAIALKAIQATQATILTAINELVDDDLKAKLQAINDKQDAQLAELEAARTDISNVDENVLEGLGQPPPMSLAETLRNGMSDEKWAAFVQAVNEVEQ